MRRPHLRRAVATAVDWGRAGRDLTAAGFSKLRRATAGEHREAECAPIPIVILPGVLEPWRYLIPLGNWLAANGHPVHYVERLGFNLRGLAASVEHVVELVADRDLSGAVFVAHSKGGLIGKLALAHPELKDRVAGMVTFATPFAGSGLGGPLQRLPFVSRSPLGLFLAGSEPLESLSADTSVNNRIVSMSAAWDQVVSRESTRLPGATHVDLTAGGHFAPVRDPHTWELMHQHLHALAD